MNLITKQLRQIIKEELDSLLLEEKYSTKDPKIFDSPDQFSLEEFRNIKQRKPKNAYNSKPKGLWYSCGGAWRDWMEEEQFTPPKEFKYAYQIIINRSKMLMINSLEALDAFHEKYSFKKDKYTYLINWKKVQKDGYAGIEICPYQWDRRHEYKWYYPWDVASGCIWNREGIIKVVELDEATD